MVTTESPYEQCPVLAGENLELRLVSLDDAADLLNCYSDPRAHLLFNADNCTDQFAYSTLEEMRQAITFWLEEYKRKYYVRFSIIDQTSGQAIGTVEMFTKQAGLEAIPVGVLRIDLQSSFESEAVVEDLIQIVEANFPKYFAYTAILTKVVNIAENRIKVFQRRGFGPLRDKTLMNFDDYYIKHY